MANKSDDTEETKVTGVEDIQNALEGALEPQGDEEDQDESTDDDDKSTDDESEEDDSKDDSDEDSDSDDDSEDDSDEDEDEDKDDESKGERRFTQFKGDGTDEAYLKNLEDGYKNSSEEGVRLNAELTAANRRLAAIDRAIQANPELGEKLQQAVGATESKPVARDKNRDPFLRNSEREWREKSEKEAEEFINLNPEVLSDPKINADVKRLMAKFSEIELEENDRLMTAGEAMEKAYAYLGLEVKTKQKTEVASAAKKLAAPTRPQKSKKKSASSDNFTDLQLKLAGKMGVSKETLSKYNK